ncbi:hypothetical protein B0J17DRAFT_358606 [Rhizoctonia solani]|nr:hypothetical protein B0J17DRAFT_358606 [Rhizoctonia solani]
MPVPSCNGLRLPSETHDRALSSMQSLVLGLVCIPSLLLPSTVAGNALRPNHAVPELLVVPNNLTIMTPRDMSSVFERQVFDLGSPFSSGFSGFTRLATRQGCSANSEVCQNDPTTCCQIGGDCCGGGACCNAGSFCYGGGCCASTKEGCNNRGCCDRDAECCSSGGCCGNGSHCVTINDQLGCCPNGQTCISEPQCNRTGFSPCPNETFCCPTGNVCSRDSAGEPVCNSPNVQTSTSVVSVPPSILSSTTAPAVTATQQVTSSFTPPPPPTTTRISTSQTLVTSAPHSSAEATTASHLSTRPGSNPPETHDQSSRTVQPSGSGAVFAQSQSTTNVGAIAGGTVAGVVALVAILILLIIWRRKQSSGGPDAETPAVGLGDEPSHNHAYSPDAVPPTPGTVDPFLTPMSQHPNPGISYFTGAVDRPISGTSSTPHYTGLPEPQHSDDMGTAIGTIAMPVPRHDIHHPHPLPMSVTPLREPTPDSPPVRVWSGFGSRPSSGQYAAYAGGNAPYQSPSGWSNHETTNTNSAYSNPPSAINAYSPTLPPRAPSTVYQPASEGGGYNGNHDMYSPPASPLPDSLYPRAFAENLGGLPGGAAPPVTNFTPGEQPLYRSDCPQ